jgi:hypothetical protein
MQKNSLAYTIPEVQASHSFPPKPLDLKLSHQIISGFCKDSSPGCLEESGCAVCGQLTPRTALSNLKSIANQLHVLESEGGARKERKKASEEIGNLAGPIIDHTCDQICEKGLIKAMSQVQCTAARWITGNFRTAPGGSGECLGGLLPMHLLLQRQADRGALCIAQLAPSHPLRPILGEALGGCHRAHRLGLAPSGALSVTSLKGPSVDAAVGAGALSWDEVEPFGPDSFPGSHVADLFQPRIHTHAPPSRKDDEVTKYKTSLDVAWAAACGNEACCVVAADASVPSGGVFQAAAAALVFRRGRCHT